MSDIFDCYKIATAEGSYNKDFLPHIQILGRPQETVAAADITAFAKKPGILARAFSFASKGALQSAFEKLVEARAYLWTPRAMHGAEYERGGFESFVARTLVKEKLETSAVSLDVNLDILPSKDACAYVKEPRSLYDRLTNEDKIDLPRNLPATVYIIAPQKNMRAAIEMVQTFAAEKQETVTHRGMGFNQSVAYQTLSDDAKEKAGAHNDNVGWFEIRNGVFFTIDKDMFERAKAAFGISEERKKTFSFGLRR